MSDALMVWRLLALARAPAAVTAVSTSFYRASTASPLNRKPFFFARARTFDCTT